jgi:hypothetical protein
LTFCSTQNLAKFREAFRNHSTSLNTILPCHRLHHTLILQKFPDESWDTIESPSPSNETLPYISKNQGAKYSLYTAIDTTPTAQGQSRDSLRCNDVLKTCGYCTLHLSLVRALQLHTRGDNWRNKGTKNPEKGYAFLGSQCHFLYQIP